MRVDEALKKLMEVMGGLKGYSMRLLFLLIMMGAVGEESQEIPQWYIQDKANLCATSVQLAIKELVEKGYLIYERGYPSSYLVTL